MGTTIWLLSLLFLDRNLVMTSELLQTMFQLYDNPTGVVGATEVLFSRQLCAVKCNRQNWCSAFIYKKDTSLCHMINWKGGFDTLPLGRDIFYVQSDLCVDSHADCPTWAANGQCDSWDTVQHCPWSCKYCGYEAGYGDCLSDQTTRIRWMEGTLYQCLKECSNRSECVMIVYNHVPKTCFLLNACDWNSRTSGTDKIEVSYRKAWP